jgi:hypothetical protein
LEFDILLEGKTDGQRAVSEVVGSSVHEETFLLFNVRQGETFERGYNASTDPNGPVNTDLPVKLFQYLKYPRQVISGRDNSPYCRLFHCEATAILPSGRAQDCC